MNWNPLKRLSLLKLQNRSDWDPNTLNASEQLERLIADFDRSENVTKSLHQSSKKLLDQILCVGKFELTLTEDLSTSDVFSNDDSMRVAIEEWNSMASVNNSIGDEYVISLQKTVIDPLKHLRQAFLELRAQIKLHDAIQLDVIKFQRKVVSCSDKEKTGANLVKLEESKQALAASQREYTKQTQQLVNDLSKFLSASVEMLRPLFEGFIAAEFAWIRACKRTMDTKSRLISTLDNQRQSDRLKSIEDSFKALGTLSICSDSKQ